MLAAVLPMLLTLPVSNFPAPTVSWSDVARVCRRVCVLRERGLPDEAENLRAGALIELLAAVRAPADTDASVMERLEATFAVEAERVANAAVLAELLVPLLSEVRTPALPPGLRPVPPAEVARPTKPVTPRTAASIADFIDEMIAQENPPNHSGGGAQRRAS